MTGRASCSPRRSAPISTASAVACGRRAVIASASDSGRATARDLAAAGVEVTVVEPRSLLGVTGGHGVRVGTGRDRGPTHDHPCDLVATSGGWTPTVHLTSHLGVKPVYREDIDAFVPGRLGPDAVRRRRVTGAFTTAEAIRSGEAAGREAAATLRACWSRRRHRDAPTCRARPVQPSPPSFSCRAARSSSISRTTSPPPTSALAHREGFRSVEHLKRYTTLGMGTDQGKTANVVALKLMAAARGVSVPEAGTTTFRPPYAPVAVGALAGRAVGQHFKPIRRTPLDAWHGAHGAEMIDVGLWKRPLNYPQAGEAGEPAYVTEMRLVRSAAGMVDVSTLGKIEVVGPDAVAFA